MNKRNKATYGGLLYTHLLLKQSDISCGRPYKVSNRLLISHAAGQLGYIANSQLFEALAVLCQQRF